MLNYKENVCLNIEDGKTIKEGSCCLVVPFIKNHFWFSLTLEKKKSKDKPVLKSMKHAG